MRIILSAFEAVDAIAARGRVIEAAKQAAERRLARRDTADQTDALAGLDRQADGGERLALGFGIAEARMVELQARVANLLTLRAAQV